jgi:hypothetical protein
MDRQIDSQGPKHGPMSPLDAYTSTITTNLGKKTNKQTKQTKNHGEIVHHVSAEEAPTSSQSAPPMNAKG